MPLLDQIRSSVCGEKEREPHPRKGTQLDTMAFFGWIIIIAYEQNRYHDVMRLFFVLCCSGCCAGAPCARASCYQLAALANRRQPQRSSSSKPTTYELTRGTSSQLSSTSTPCMQNEPRYKGSRCFRSGWSQIHNIQPTSPQVAHPLTYSIRRLQ